MLEFTENKERKRDSKAEEKKVPVPAWEDKNESKLKVNIQKESRLRKLKTTEDEKVIKGNEYSSRLQAEFNKM